MNRLQTPRFPITLASLALLVVPFGCGSESPTTVEVPPPPTVIVDAPPVPNTLDNHVYQTSGQVMEAEAHHAKDDARQAEGDAKKAVGDVEQQAKDTAKELEADARKSAEDALDKLLPAPK